MNVLDLVIVVLLVGTLLGSYRLGFIARSVSWLGMAVGILVAVRLLPRIFDGLGDVSSRRVVWITVAVLFGGALAGQSLGLLLGRRLRFALPTGRLRTADRLLGALAGVALVLVAVWLVTPIMADTPGWPAEQARGSRIARLVEERFPESPDAVRAVRRLIGEDRFPQVFAALQPAPDLGAPPDTAVISDEVAASVSRSVLRVGGLACGRLLNGSGFLVRDDLAVTNAHVVAGATETTVTGTDGNEHEAAVVAFDPARDLALLRVSGAGLEGLPVADPDGTTSGGVFGFPAGGNLRVAPFSVAREVRAIGLDIYNEARTTRSVYELSTDLEPGDSGAALVDESGSVVGVAFAIAPDNEHVAYALTTDELAAVLGQRLAEPVDTGRCLG